LILIEKNSSFDVPAMRFKALLVFIIRVYIE